VLDLTVVRAALESAWRWDSKWHGELHWRCVAATGLALADDLPGADRELVFLFGLLHDMRRENDHVDPQHGPRAAELTRELNDVGVIRLADARLESLCRAIDLHTRGFVSTDETVGACWDADRLHLPRVGIDPDPDRFSTALAHGPCPLDAAAVVRAAPPDWATILDAVG
jgi:uncharacterized protein